MSYQIRTGAVGAAVTLFTVVFLASATVGGPLPAVHDEKDLPRQALAETMVVYHRTATAPSFADYIPSSAEVAGPWKIAMAGAEYEPLQVGIYVPRERPALRNVRIEVQSDLPHQVGHIYYQHDKPLPDVTNANWTWREAQRPDRGKPWEGKDAVMPLSVMPIDRIDLIRPGQSGAFWITFKADTATRPGQHRGTFRLTAADNVEQSIDFVVEVHPFTLPRPRIPFTLYYFPYHTPSAFQGRRFQKMYLDDMAAHGCNAMHIYVDYQDLSQPDYDLTTSSAHHEFRTSPTCREYCENYFTAEDFAPGGGYNVVKFIDAQIRMGRRAGIVQNDLPLISGQSQWNIDGKANLVSALSRFGDEFGWPTIVLYTRDEPPPKVFAEVTEHITQFKQLGALMTTAMYMDGAFNLGPLHDIWIMAAGEVTPQLMHEAHLQGAQVWSYNTRVRTANAEISRYLVRALHVDDRPGWKLAIRLHGRAAPSAVFR